MRREVGYGSDRGRIGQVLKTCRNRGPEKSYSAFATRCQESRAGYAVAVNWGARDANPHQARLKYVRALFALIDRSWARLQLPTPTPVTTSVGQAAWPPIHSPKPADLPLPKPHDCEAFEHFVQL